MIGACCELVGGFCISLVALAARPALVGRAGLFGFIGGGGVHTSSTPSDEATEF